MFQPPAGSASARPCGGGSYAKTPTSMPAKTTPVKTAARDIAPDRAAIQKYITIQALHDSYQVTFEKAGFIVKLFSLGQATGLKGIDIDMELYNRLKIEYAGIIRTRVHEMLSQPRIGWAAYVQYVAALANKTRQLQLAMEELRNHVMRHNQGQEAIAQEWGRGYAKLKFAADLTVAGLSFFTPFAGSAAAYHYTKTTELIALVGDPKSADIMAFKGTGTGLVFLVAQGTAEVTGKTAFGKGASGAGAIVSMIFAGLDLKANLEKFK